jgi:GTP-binding protein
VSATSDRTPQLAPHLPVLALVGRPNVGKSAIFNRIVGERRAIVDDVPGVTRDRLVAAARHDERSFLCIDTGGFDAGAMGDAASLAGQVRAQALAAVEEADCLVCVLDGQAGLSPADTELVRLLARTGTPVVVAVNKSDVPSHDARAGEFHRLGIEHVIPTSAAHARGIDELLDAALAVMQVAPSADAQDVPGTRVALMGRPNVGKSSLLNRLLGTERVLVSHEPGTTRDTIDTPVVVDGRPYVLIDTAGIRRRGRVSDAVERHGAVRALGALVRSDVVLMVLDATQGVTDQDSRLIGRAVEAGRAVVLVVNKWDLQPRSEQSLPHWRRRVEALHAAAVGLPVIAVSALTGEGVAGIFPLVRRLETAYARVLPTATLNRALRDAVDAHAPPSPGGRPVRLFYAAQTGTKPPRVVVFASAPSLLREAYRRYLLNALRERFKLEGVPLRLSFRARREALSEQRRSPARGSAPRARRSARPKPRSRGPRRG